MSGFDPAWLDLREPADAEARDSSLLAKAAALFADRSALRIADLGCGTGSLLRALSPLLPARQHWLLIDGDPAVLEAAIPRLSQWADSAQSSSDGLRLQRAGQEIEITFRQIDLAAFPLPVEPGEADLIGASALFDLVSAAWLERFASSLAMFGAPLYAALSYDGRMFWAPPHPDDARVEALFNQHQTRDKGTGAALGPGGAAALAEALTGRGFDVACADSPWRLTSASTPLIRAVRDGVADAVQEIEPAPWIKTWRAASCSAASIGHLDLLATV